MLSAREQDYRDEADFEVAVSVATSIGVQALADQQALTAVCGGRPMATGSRTLLLDAASGLTFGGGPSLTQMAAVARRAAPTVTMALHVCGGQTNLAELRAAATRWSRDVRVIAVRVDPTSRTAFQPVGEMLVLTVSDLKDLPRLLWVVSRR